MLVKRFSMAIFPMMFSCCVSAVDVSAPDYQHIPLAEGYFYFAGDITLVNSHYHSNLRPAPTVEAPLLLLFGLALVFVGIYPKRN